MKAGYKYLASPRLDRRETIKAQVASGLEIITPRANPHKCLGKCGKVGARNIIDTVGKLVE